MQNYLHHKVSLSLKSQQLEKNLGPNSISILSIGGEMGKLCLVFIFFQVSTFDSALVSAVFSDHIFMCDFDLLYY